MCVVRETLSLSAVKNPGCSVHGEREMCLEAKKGCIIRDIYYGSASDCTA